MSRPQSISEFTLANNQQDNNSIQRRKHSVRKHLTKPRSCGLCFCTRCPWQDLISDTVVKCFISFDLCLLRLNKDFSFFGFLRNDCIWINACMHASFFVRECDYFLPCQYDSGRSSIVCYSIVWFAGFWISTDSAIFGFEYLECAFLGFCACVGLWFIEECVVLRLC